MNKNSLYVLIVCFFLCTCSIFGQQDSSLFYGNEETHILLQHDALSHDGYVTEKYNIMKLEGYFICYCYKTENSYYNYNLIFVPFNDITKVLIQNLVKKSLVINKKQPLLENYFISDENMKEFENIFKFTWVVIHNFSFKYDSLSDGYTEGSLNILASEWSQFHESRTQSKSKIRIQDSIGIIYKLLPIEGVFKIEAYNDSSQMNHYDYMYSNSNYYREGKAKQVHYYGLLRLCSLDYRLISPILSQVVAIEFKDRRWRRFVSQKYGRK